MSKEPESAEDRHERITDFATCHSSTELRMLATKEMADFIGALCLHEISNTGTLIWAPRLKMRITKLKEILDALNIDIDCLLDCISQNTADALKNNTALIDTLGACKIKDRDFHGKTIGEELSQVGFREVPPKPSEILICPICGALDHKTLRYQGAIVLICPSAPENQIISYDIKTTEKPNEQETAESKEAES